MDKFVLQQEDEPVRIGVVSLVPNEIDPWFKGLALRAEPFSFLQAARWGRHWLQTSVSQQTKPLGRREGRSPAGASPSQAATGPPSPPPAPGSIRATPV